MEIHILNGNAASYEDRIALTKVDVALAENLWNAYAAGNFKTLQALAATPTNAFHDLDKVVQVQIGQFPHILANLK